MRRRSVGPFWEERQFGNSGRIALYFLQNIRDSSVSCFIKSCNDFIRLRWWWNRKRQHQFQAGCSSYFFFFPFFVFFFFSLHFFSLHFFSFSFFFAIGSSFLWWLRVIWKRPGNISTSANVQWVSIACYGFYGTRQKKYANSLHTWYQYKLRADMSIKLSARWKSKTWHRVADLLKSHTDWTFF